MAISIQAPVGELVVQQPGRAPVFERLGIDYCCKGSQTLVAACRAAGLSVTEVCQQLEASDNAPGAREEDWTSVSLCRLIEHIVEIHHNFLRSELPRLEHLMTKVALHHGLKYRGLLDLATTFLALKRELLNHMEKEEQELFPMIRRLEVGEPAHYTIADPISVMEEEHRQIGEALERMRWLTDDYAPPADACSAYRTLLIGLADLEEDLHQHIHKENNILFLRAERLERTTVAIA